MQLLEELSAQVIGAAIRVHTALGPGFLESVYEEALCVEIQLLGLSFERQLLVPINYEGVTVGSHRLDLVVEHALVVELRTVQGFEPIHFPIFRSYLKAADQRVGLPMNFAGIKLQVKRVGREWHSRIK